ncbi:co-regulatory protein PtrA N-terminal domain-containing protein [Pseudomonas sp. NY15437]|uniref:Uncharacterized protein n=1 Tax=Pseudomonas nitroreducens TaxID=46680 RepID=A0ABS0KDW9_PSENT|nr:MULTISPECIES: co-regulatory protein PtrA N-terminal domain-containing protein [Pseudomonas]MBG6286287.1 hypothetical protein [Pseudomonas nitroreducens]NNN25456.1 hypothetical protein [Pseudomonas nitroreducens]UCL90210.1 hypothetical protein LDJ84_30530 [Pseudomonas sp. HS-18]
MNSLKTLLAIVAFAASSLAMAESGGDRTFAKMEQIRQSFVGGAQISQEQKVTSPVAESNLKGDEHSKC